MREAVPRPLQVRWGGPGCAGGDGTGWKAPAPAGWSPGPGGAWWGLAGPGGAWWGMAGPGGAWWGLVGPGGAWPPRRGCCRQPWRFPPLAAEEVAGGSGPVRGSLHSGTVPGWCPAPGRRGRGCPANGIHFRGSHPAQPDLCCPLEMCGRFISTNFLSTKCI